MAAPKRTRAEKTFADTWVADAILNNATKFAKIVGATQADYIEAIFLGVKITPDDELPLRPLIHQLAGQAEALKALFGDRIAGKLQRGIRNAELAARRQWERLEGAARGSRR